MYTVGATWCRWMERRITNGSRILGDLMISRSGDGARSIGRSSSLVMGGILSMGCLLGGCALGGQTVADASVTDTCQRAEVLVREAQAELAALRAEMATTRIAAAKKEAEVMDLRRQLEAVQATEVQVNRKYREHRVELESHQATLTQLRLERDRLEQEKAALQARLTARVPESPPKSAGGQRTVKVDTRMEALEASVVALTTQVKALHVQGQDAGEPEAGSGAEPMVISVKPGDTLSELARDYGVTINAIKKANGLKTDLILIGQQLWIPAR